MSAPLALDALNDCSYQPPTLPDLWSLAVLADHWTVWTNLLSISSAENGRSCPVCVTCIIYIHLHTYTCGTYIYIIATIYLRLPPYMHSSAYACSVYSHHFHHVHHKIHFHMLCTNLHIYHLYHLNDLHTYALVSMHVDMSARIFQSAYAHIHLYICATGSQPSGGA